MTFQSSLQLCAFLSALLLIPVAAFSQTTLTGAVVFSTSPGGSVIDESYWNTLGGDHSFDLWLALDPSATIPVNGPTDELSAINIPLEPARTYKYYTFGQADVSTSFTGINLFFNGDNATPGISAFGPLNGSTFLPDSSSTYSLQINPTAGSGNTFYNSGQVIVLLTGFDWNSPKTYPGNVCQPYTFTPGDNPVFFGSFSLEVFSAAKFTIGSANVQPLTHISLSGIGFAPTEKVGFFADGLGSPLIGTVTTDASGSFATNINAPQAPYGTLNLFALGGTSGDLGAAKISVTAGLFAAPQVVAPGGATTAQGVGFGSGETVSVYLDEPRELLGTATADRVGSFISSNAATVQIPANAKRGLNGFIGVGQTTNAIGLGKLVVE